jgi:hypothetical protein
MHTKNYDSNKVKNHNKKNGYKQEDSLIKKQVCGQVI